VSTDVLGALVLMLCALVMGAAMGWRDQGARFLWLWGNSRYAQTYARDTVRDAFAADELSRAQDGSMGFPRRSCSQRIGGRPERL
jgi:hypothetical protein